MTKILNPISATFDYIPKKMGRSDIVVSNWPTAILHKFTDTWNALWEKTWMYENKPYLKTTKLRQTFRSTLFDEEFQAFAVEKLSERKPTLLSSGWGYWLSLVWVLSSCGISIWWHYFFCPVELNKQIDLDNPNNLLTGPNRVFISEDQKYLIEREESQRYIELMDNAVVQWRLLNIPEDSPATLEFLLKYSGEAFKIARREITEKHWLPYSIRFDSDEITPQTFTRQARGLDRRFLWEQIAKERNTNDLLTRTHAIALLEEYKKTLKEFRIHNSTSRYTIRYFLEIFKIWYKYKTNKTKPKYETKWHDLGRKMLDDEDTWGLKY